MFSPIVSDLKYFGVSIGELGGVLRLRLRGLGLGFASHILSAKNNIFLIQTPHKSNLINLIEHRRVFWIYWEVAPWILTTMAHFLLFIESCLQFQLRDCRSDPASGVGRLTDSQVTVLQDDDLSGNGKQSFATIYHALKHSLCAIRVFLQTKLPGWLWPPSSSSISLPWSTYHPTR